MKFKTKKKKKRNPLAVHCLGLRVSLPSALVPALIRELKIPRAAQPKKKLVKIAEFKYKMSMARWTTREAEAATPSSQLLSCGTSIAVNATYIMLNQFKCLLACKLRTWRLTVR